MSFGWERALMPRREIRRGDVVVFRHPPEPEVDYVKRVVGLPGEVVELRDGRLYIGGRLIEEPYVEPRYRDADRKKNYGPVEVRADHYFVLGDHRNASKDSRFWSQVPRELLKGRAFLVLFSAGGAAEGRVTPVSILGRLYRLVVAARWERTFRLIR